MTLAPSVDEEDGKGRTGTSPLKVTTSARKKGCALERIRVICEHTRAALAICLGRTCTAEDVVAVIGALVATRGAPAHLKMDNGPELIAWTLHDWCRFNDTITSYIEPGSPWESPFVESFNGRVRDELLNIEEFATLYEAHVVIGAWRIEYDTYRPHSSLGGCTPVEYAERRTINQPALEPPGRSEERTDQPPTQLT